MKLTVPGDSREAPFITCKRAVVFDVVCYNRRVIVMYDDGIEEDKLRTMLDARYVLWCNGDEGSHDFCCEEYLLKPLRDQGIKFIVAYVDEEDEA